MFVFINIQLDVQWEHHDLATIKITGLFNPVTKRYNGIFEEIPKFMCWNGHKLYKIMAARFVSPFSLNCSLACSVNSENSERKICWSVMICSD